jgi:cob(I)alamin adenosyltransferase
MSEDRSPRPPTERPDPGTVRESSLVLVNTGDGKGKSTAAFGTMLRAIARGWRVSVVQFLKSGDWKVGEEKVAVRLGVDWWAIGDGFTWDSEDMSESEAIARRAWEFAARVVSGGEYELVVLDEITYPVNWGWIDAGEVVETIRTRPAHTNVIVTGRDAPGPIVDIADTVTEMVKVKHAYDRGVMARRGLDY